MNGKKRIALICTVLITCLALLFLAENGFFSLSSAEMLRDYIASAAPYSHLVFFIIQLLSVIFAPIPSNLSAVAGGMLFGTLWSFLLTFAAVLLGSMLVFSLARYFGQDFADRFVSRRLSERYRETLHVRTTTFLFLAFLFPYFPDDILCLLAGLTSIPRRRFLLILLLARPWGLLFACALGGTSLSLPLPVLILLGLGGVALFLLGMKYGPAAEQAILRRLHEKKADASTSSGD